jgi:photosystem II stability/assembly factor-like uncharacterized protein
LLTEDMKFSKIVFLNNNFGFISRCSYDQNLFKTTDGGNSWIDISPNILPLGIMDIQFPTRLVGYAIGCNKDSVLAKTINGGNTWSSLKLPPLPEIPWTFHFITDSIGFMGYDKVFKTMNGGLNWTLTNSKMGWVDRDRIVQYYFLDSQTGFVITEHWNIYKTIDSGNLWEHISIPIIPSYGCRRMAFNDKFGFIFGYSILYPFTSHDHGTSWIIDSSYPILYPASCISSYNNKIMIGTITGHILIRTNED